MKDEKVKMKDLHVSYTLGSPKTCNEVQSITDLLLRTFIVTIVKRSH